jgi:hypothetical protein
MNPDLQHWLQVYMLIIILVLPSIIMTFAYTSISIEAGQLLQHCHGAIQGSHCLLRFNKTEK